MALIPHAQLDELIRKPVSINLEDLGRRAAHLEREARARAEQILKCASVERTEILAGAKEEGLVTGHAEGFKAGRSEGLEAGRAEILAQMGPQIEGLVGSWTTALEGFDSSRNSMLSEARTDVIRLALAITSIITHRVVELDQDVVCAQLESVLEMITRPTKLRIEVHPEDQEVLQDAIPEMLERFENATHAEVHTNDALVRGSVVVKRDSGGVLDASITSQLVRMSEEILPGESENAS